MGGAFLCAGQGEGGVRLLRVFFFGMWDVLGVFGRELSMSLGEMGGGVKRFFFIYIFCIFLNNLFFYFLNLTLFIKKKTSLRQQK